MPMRSSLRASRIVRSEEIFLDMGIVLSVARVGIGAPECEWELSGRYEGGVH